MKKKILVTGGAGFIGSHVVDLLVEHGHEVTVFDNLSTGKVENINPRATFLWGDIRNRAELGEVFSGKDVCIHLAAVASVAKSIDKWSDSSGVNALGSANVFDLSQKNGIERIIYASSAAVYGVPEKTPITESSRIAPLSPYGADKYLSELYGQAAYGCFGLKSVGLRFFNVYGPRQDPLSPYSGVISAFIDRVRKGMPITIYGDGLQTRDFIYVGDVAKIILEFVSSGVVESDVFNICTNKCITIKALAEKLLKISSADRKIQYLAPRTGDIRESLGSNMKLEKFLGKIVYENVDHGLMKTFSVL